MKAVTHYQINSAITLAKLSNVKFLCWNFSHHINCHTNMLSKCIVSTSGFAQKTLILNATIMLTWTVHSDQVRWNIGRAWGPAKKFRALEIYGKEKNCYQLCFLLFNNNVYLKNNEDDYRKCVSMFINHKIAYDTHDMKMTPLSPLFFFCKVRGQCYRFLVSVLTAISSHCLEALPVCA